ncbi:hypothetical protein V8F33_008342 [Rhypophila sp. PSN 637]
MNHSSVGVPYSARSLQAMNDELTPHRPTFIEPQTCQLGLCSVRSVGGWIHDRRVLVSGILDTSPKSVSRLRRVRWSKVADIHTGPDGLVNHQQLQSTNGALRKRHDSNKRQQQFVASLKPLQRSPLYVTRYCFYLLKVGTKRHPTVKKIACATWKALTRRHSTFHQPQHWHLRCRLTLQNGPHFRTHLYWALFIQGRSQQFKSKPTHAATEAGTVAQNLEYFFCVA